MEAGMEPNENSGSGGRSRPWLWLWSVHSRQTVRRLAALREQSGWWWLVMAVFLAGYLGLSFWLFWRGFRFVGSFPGLGTILAERLMFLLFACLFVLLVFSNLIIGFSQFFRNRETIFLLSMPISAQSIFRWKFSESTLLACWAFLFLVAPLLAAYGMNQGVRWHYYVVAPLYIGMFLMLPAVAGAWVALLLARYLDRRSFQWLALALLALAIAGGAWWWRPEMISDEMLETRVMNVLDRLLVRTQAAQFAFLPSYWLSAGVMNWSEGALRTAFFFGLVLLSYVMLFGYAAMTRTGRLFYEGVSAVQSRSGGVWVWPFAKGRRKARVRAPAGSAPRGLEAIAEWFPWVRPEARALLVKDARMFWRDTSQWGQTLLIFGLLAVYMLNLRQFSHQLTHVFWYNLTSLLNLLACSLNVATLTTRFVFPQFSLEGKRLWIVGLAPLSLAQILRAKFRFASGGALSITAGLMLFSGHMLQLPWHRTLLFTAAIAVMTLTLTALALGLGVIYPNPREDNPSKIVSGFGGTFCLVLSFVYICGSVTWLAMSLRWVHTRFAGDGVGMTSLGLFLGWSILFGWIPWRIALRRVATFEL